MLVAVLGGVVTGVLLAQWALQRAGRVRSRPDSAGPRDRDRPAGAGVRTGGDTRHRAGDRSAARLAGRRRERAGSAQGGRPRLDRIGPAPSRESAGGRSVAVARVADRRRSAADQLRAAPAGVSRASSRTASSPRSWCCRRSATRARSSSPSTSSCINAWRTLPGTHVGRADRPRAADRRAIAGAGGGHGPSRAADERTAAREPPPRVAALLQHAGHPDPRRTRLRRARQRPRAARGDRQRDLRPAALSRRGSDRPHPDHGDGAAAVADRRGGGGRPQHHA